MIYNIDESSCVNAVAMAAPVFPYSDFLLKQYQVQDYIVQRLQEL